MYPIVDAGGRWYPLFALWTTGRIELQFGTLKSRPPFDQPAVRQELVRRLTAIPGVQIPPSRADAFPKIPMAAISTTSSRKAFLKTFEWAVQQIRAHAAVGGTQG